MGFFQIIEYKSSHIEALRTMGKEFREQSAEVPGVKPLRGWLTADQDRPGYYLTVLEYESPEAAKEAMGRPETHEYFGYLRQVMDGPARFYNLSVLETWET